MPSSDTSNLSETLMGLTGQLLGSPPVGDTLVSVTTSDSDDIDHLILREEISDNNGLLEERPGEGDLISGFSTVDLDLHKVSLLLLQLEELGLCVAQNSDS